MSLSSGQANPGPGSDSTNERKWWKRYSDALNSDALDSDTLVGTSRPQKGEPCPKCYMADLDWDSLFRLHCPNCGYVAECGAFT